MQWTMKFDQIERERNTTRKCHRTMSMPLFSGAHAWDRGNWHSFRTLFNNIFVSGFYIQFSKSRPNTTRFRIQNVVQRIILWHKKKTNKLFQFWTLGKFRNLVFSFIIRLCKMYLLKKKTFKKTVSTVLK